MDQINILVTDDEREIADLLEIYLVSDGYRVWKAYSAKEGLQILQEHDIQLAILDIMMPEMDGIEMCRQIRKFSNIPVIFLSAKSADLDKILGLGCGADDYVTKPFSPLELTARVKSQLRRYTEFNPDGVQKKDASEIISIRGVVINRTTHVVTVDGEEIKLIFFVCWHKTQARCSAQTKSLKTSGMKLFTRQIIPLWYISAVFVQKSRTIIVRIRS